MHFSVFLTIPFVKACPSSLFTRIIQLSYPLGRAMHKKRSPLAESRELLVWSWRPCLSWNPKAPFHINNSLLLSQSWDRWILSISSQPIKINFNNAPTSTHLGLPSCLFPFGFPIWNIVLKTTRQISRVKVITVILLRIQVTHRYVVNNYRGFDESWCPRFQVRAVKFYVGTRVYTHERKQELRNVKSTRYVCYQ